MKKLIASHSRNIYLKPGEVFVSRAPALVSTVLGSCVAVTMYSASRGLGAICHAMLPENTRADNDLRYVDTALQHIIEQFSRYGAVDDLEIKLFGGAQVLEVGDITSERVSIGDQNITKAEAVLASMGLSIFARNTGGHRGRKLFFCTRSGDVYMRFMRLKHNQKART